MSKKVFLFVKGDDYAALEFNQNFDAQTVYEDMVKEGVTFKIFESDEFYIEVHIKEFGEIDPKFISFIRDEIHDYDNSKHYDFIEVVPNL